MDTDVISYRVTATWGGLLILDRSYTDVSTFNRVCAYLERYHPMLRLRFGARYV